MTLRYRISFLAAVLIVATTASAELTLQLQGDAVVATGATPGQQVFFYGISHDVESYAGTIVHHESLLGADSGGVAAWHSGAVSPRSLWFAVDVQTGAVAVTTPDGFPLRRMDAPEEVVKRKELMEALEVPFFYAEVLFVRPGGGVWAETASRGGSKDLKTKSGALTLDPKVFRKLRGSDPGPDKVRRDDVIIVIEPYSLAFFSTQWKQ